ncbi:hypothetical protein COS31_01470 [Candidatus Roizmanbacteria bacterium CG02_land_8_20_14_3_00_36_15]|uniref:Shikimate kinase n=2 Tax=Candidatus Roizmaniibacteriota TaxID=1752723 RepID=A0A2M8KLC8_9BACT|nr:MAG: hypothetical protein COS51_04930 [Candidatus Roizmanbacteria bacterium CG03_land_8_20_14_0_80_36_21]PIV38050.1 MAG: hypothetical protein COS31_01470 [Candidatus Roizmanbacteria bacterium CG02_land_8_20_14_3_00_36_15]PIY70223.1 MAG: hypothetical protein COY89_02270 [Candidatus Roizmanbacteria bacterium CG_4_10_14_0_8_um_filter_36_36]PJA52950.1 MAG: hypothetical protein CO166_03575 [Candidatus Roizmanbacteria bacterium CG_4_9_14_3_um_filter_36_11]PJC82285.1 MAG: hypothetical protein CO007
MDNLILIGLKNCGKTTLARKISDHFKMYLIKIDDLIEKQHAKDKKEKLTFREIFKKWGKDYFRSLETRILKEIERNKLKEIVVDCGGGVPMREENRQILKKIGKVVFIDLDKEINFIRIMNNGIPAFFKYKNDPKKSFVEYEKERRALYGKLADYIIRIKNESPEEILKKIIKLKIFNV